MDDEHTDPMDSGAARRVLRSYLSLLESRRRGEKASRPSDPPLRRVGKRLVPPAMRLASRRAATALVAGRERSKARRLERAGPLKIHLGCGATRKEGWVNVDLLGDPVDIAWNLDRPLPFRSSVADAVFLEHVLEHFTVPAGFRLLSEVRRVLKPGGVARIGVPDGWRYAESYVKDPGGFLEEIGPGRPTPLLAMQEIYYLEGHLAMYDAQTLSFVCAAAGFASAGQRQFGDSRVEPCPDSEHRRLETLYVEAVR